MIHRYKIFPNFVYKEHRREDTGKSENTVHHLVLIVIHKRVQTSKENNTLIKHDRTAKLFYTNLKCSRNIYIYKCINLTSFEQLLLHPFLNCTLLAWTSYWRHFFICVNSNPIDESKEELPETDLPTFAPIHFFCNNPQINKNGL